MKYPALHKIFGKIWVPLVLIGILIVPLVYSSLTTNWIINCSGTITIARNNCYNITAASSSPQDIQNAVNWAVGNTTGAYTASIVQIPAGTYTFNPYLHEYNVVGVYIPFQTNNLTIVGAGQGKTILQETQNAGVDSWMFKSRTQTGPQQPVGFRLTNMTLVGYVDTESTSNAQGLELDLCANWRVDHCTFINFNGFAIGTTDHAGVYGYNDTFVVDNCNFVNNYTGNAYGGYGVLIGGSNPGPVVWDDLSNCVGTFDQMHNQTQAYIENCTFNGMRHDVTSNCGAWYTIRYCYDYNSISGTQIDVHGTGYTISGRGCEAYNNTIIGSPTGFPSSWGVVLRGGNSFIFNNTFENLGYGLELWNETMWWSGVTDNEQKEMMLNFTFVWSNTYSNVTNVFGGYNEDWNLTQGIDFFTFAPNATNQLGNFNGANYATLPYPFPFDTYGVPNADLSTLTN